MRRVRWVHAALLALAGCNGAPSAAPERGPELAPAAVASPSDWGLAEVLALVGDSGGSLVVGARLEPGARVEVPAGVRVELGLTDGTRLRLDEGTVLQLARGDAGAQLERGEVVVIGPSAGGNHTVAAGEDRIELARGEVRVWTDGSRHAVDLVAGAATYHSGGHELSLTPGVHVDGPLVAGVEPPAPSASLRPLDETAWTSAFALASQVADGYEAAPPGIGSLTSRRAGTSVEGQRVALTAQKVHVSITGGIARTEIEQTFTNGASQELEGRYRFPLPTDASIAGLSLLVGERWMDAEMLERDRARAIFRDIVDATVPRDPALLEWEQGNTFKLRIFPIPAHGSRSIRLAYTQVLPQVGDTLRYRYPLAGGPSIDEFEFVVEVDGEMLGEAGAAAIRTPMASLDRREHQGRVELALRGRDYAPRHELGVDLPLPAGAERIRAESFVDADGEGYFRVDLRPALAIPARARATRYALVLDRSHSNSEALWAVAEGLVASLAAGMAEDDELVVLACDTACDLGPGGLADPRAAAEAARPFLAAQQLAGASDLGGMLRTGALALGPADPAHDRVVVYLGDGQATAGALTPYELLAATEASPLAGVRIAAVALGARADLLVLDALAAKTGGDVTPVDARDDLDAVARAVALRSRLPGAGPVQVELPEGLSSVHARGLANVRAGDTVTLIGKLAGPVSGELVLRAAGPNGGEQTDRIPLALAPEPADARSRHAHLPRTWAKLEIDALTAREGEAAKRRIVALSRRYTVLSRYTALIALESDAMYREYRVARASGKTSGWDGSLAGALPEDADPPVEPATPGASAGEESPSPGPSKPTLDIGAAGTSGGGGGSGSGYGKGSGAGFGGRGTRVPQVRQGRVSAPKFRVPESSEPTPEQLAKLEALAGAVADEPGARKRRRALIERTAELGLDTLAHAEAWAEVDPDHGPALTYLADALARAHDPLAARAYASRVEGDRFDRALHQRLARSYAQTGDWTRSCAHRRALVSLTPTRVDAHVELVECLFAAGEAEEAARVAAEAVEVAEPEAWASCSRIGGLCFAPPPQVARDQARLRQLQGYADGERPTAAEERAPRGDIRASLSWTGPAELELALVDRDGNRHSAVYSSSFSATLDDHAQTLAGPARGTGDLWYGIEVARLDDGDEPVSATLELGVFGERKRLTVEVVRGRPRVAELEAERSDGTRYGGGIQVGSGLPKDIVNRIIRAHVNEVRSCYHKGLNRNPNLRGVVVVKFGLLPTGKVGAVEIAESSVADAVVGECIAAAVRRWTFPKPAGGVSLSIRYPFTLEPE